MLTIMTILVCLTTTPHDRCSEITAVDIVQGPTNGTPMGCLLDGSQTAANLVSRVVPGERYVQFHACRRLGRKREGPFLSVASGGSGTGRGRWRWIGESRQ